jgi:SAM-dependent methyltransferase
MRALKRNATEWERNARSNPLWAVLTDSRRNTQSWNVDDFFSTGHDEVRLVFKHLDGLGVFLAPGGKFLDFGCGVGRISRVLVQYFPEGFGIDISETMIEKAKAFSANDTRQACYLSNSRSDLMLIESDSIDFAYSHIVLQHVPAAFQSKFIEEFIRVLKPGGVAAFQIPTATVESAAGRAIRATKRLLHRIVPSAPLTLIKRALGRDASVAGVSMDMNICPEEVVKDILVRNNCVLLDAPYTNSTDRNHGGRIRFMSREEALAEIASGATDSPYLSQFFFVRK